MLFSACSIYSMYEKGNKENTNEKAEEILPDKEKNQSSQNMPKAGEVIEDFGTYTVSENWSEATELSKRDITFYLQNGTPTNKPTTNISVSVDKNKYSKEEAGGFAQAIDRQLRSQVGSLDLKSYSGNGTFTENDYPLIVMEIETEEMKTTQYYIVGDYRFVMVHLSEYHDESIKNAEEVALNIVNSFEWAE